MGSARRDGRSVVPGTSPQPAFLLELPCWCAALLAATAQPPRTPPTASSRRAAAVDASDAARRVLLALPHRVMPAICRRLSPDAATDAWLGFGC